ncbi:GIY-YIG nuclease family protein [Niallia circulans]|uniref:GIY-YIG nuclease family protein n=1 Tax=Niallia circulans TaxID=1397 RepID=UPI003D986D17
MYGWLVTDAMIKSSDVGKKGWRTGLPDRDIYRFYNSDGELLYIGWSTVLLERILEHIRGRSSNSKEFHHEISTILITAAKNFDNVFKYNKNVDDVEKLMVRALNPKYNKVFKKGYSNKRKPWK